jgi:hypothetical protein
LKSSSRISYYIAVHRPSEIKAKPFTALLLFKAVEFHFLGETVMNNLSIRFCFFIRPTRTPAVLDIARYFRAFFLPESQHEVLKDWILLL